MNLRLKNKIVENIPEIFMEDFHKITKTRKMNQLVKKDKKRFSAHSFVDKKLNFNQIEARLTKEYHSIEKGLSYANIRLGFGKDVLKNIIDLMEIYREQGLPLDSHVYETALSTLKEYIQIHKENNYDISNLENKVNQLSEGARANNSGGVLIKNKEDILKDSKSDFRKFSLSRLSIREYSEQPVSYEILEEALKLATHTPSACNRQPWKVRIVENSEDKKFIQANQNGNRGFGDHIDKFIIITSDVSYYDKGRERNQANIDGGMYAMNLIYSLHYYGVATVPLSASLSIAQEDNLRSRFSIPESENFVMFIGIGNYTDNFKVTKSDRRKAEYIKF